MAGARGAACRPAPMHGAAPRWPARTGRGAPCPRPAVASLGYREPSFVFLIGTDLAMLGTGTEAVEFLKGSKSPNGASSPNGEGPRPGDGCRLVYVEGRFAAEFAAAAAAGPAA